MIRPILFNSEMVRAILDERKSCTRRLVKPEPQGYFEVNEEPLYIYDTDGNQGKITPPYHPGDILYVRETWGEGYEDGTYIYKASDKLANHPMFKESSKLLYHPSIHMPKEAARIWLRVVGVQLERLQDITENGAKAEGAIDNRGFIHSPENEYNRIHTAREHFAEIWNSTIKKSDIDRYGWKANPWVWVIEFERCEDWKPEDVRMEGDVNE